MVHTKALEPRFPKGPNKTSLPRWVANPVSSRTCAKNAPPKTSEPRFAKDLRQTGAYKRRSNPISPRARTKLLWRDHVRTPFACEIAAKPISTFSLPTFKCLPSLKRIALAPSASRHNTHATRNLKSMHAQRPCVRTLFRMSHGTFSARAGRRPFQHPPLRKGKMLEPRFAKAFCKKCPA